MFMYDVQVEQSGAEWHFEDQGVAEARKEASAYQSLLTAVDAARTGLVSDEHDFDESEDQIV